MAGIACDSVDMGGLMHGPECYLVGRLQQPWDDVGCPVWGGTSVGQVGVCRYVCVWVDVGGCGCVCGCMGVCVGGCGWVCVREKR